MSPVESPGQVLCPVPIGQGGVLLLQEGVFVTDGVGHSLLVVDVQLAPEKENDKIMNTTQSLLNLVWGGSDMKSTPPPEY